MKRDEASTGFVSMQLLNRHWVWILLWLCIGICVAACLPDFPLWLTFLFIIAPLSFFLLPLRIPRKSHLILALLFFAFGATRYGFYMQNKEGDPLSRYALGEMRVRQEFEGVVVSSSTFEPKQEYTQFVMDVHSVHRGGESAPIKGRTRVRWTRPSGPVFPGMTLRVSGRLSPHLGVVNHGMRGTEDYSRSRQIYSSVSASGNAVFLIAEASPYSFRYWAARLRQWQHDQLKTIVPEDAFPFVLGVWLGERSNITAAEYDQFVCAGTAHVLSVSGLHVAIITLSLGLLLQVLRVPRRPRNVALIIGVLFFTFMAGARVSTARAAFMICLYLSSELFNRETDVLSVLGLTACLFLGWNPQLLFDTGFLLSFGSVASILLFYSGLSDRMLFMPRLLRETLAVTLAAQLITFPIAAWHFGTVPVLGIVANFVVVPLLTGVLWLCLLSSLVAAFLPGLGLLFGHAILPLVILIKGANASVLTLPAAYVTLALPSLIALFFYVSALIGFFLWLYHPDFGRKTKLTILSLLIATLLTWNLTWKEPVVDFIDVGTGDAIFLRTPGNSTLLIDGGDSSAYADAGERIVLPFLRANRIPSLDYVVVTHADRDHIGGLFQVIKNFPVKQVLMAPEGKEMSKLEKSFLKLCEEHGVPVQRLAAGDQIPVKDAQIDVLHPDASWAAQHQGNNNSLVLKIDWPGLSLLLTGDIEKEAEAALAGNQSLKATFLKIPHHGSPTSSTDSFLEEVKPAVAFASMQAAGSRQTLMTPNIAERYKAHDIQVYRTDRHGGIRLKRPLFKKQYEVFTARGARGYSLTPKN
ncbi:MAG: DNA internalization-related competence protein ComEC/Rec2 [Candidatus Hydrogenedentales bacterium]|jgi:competence protein ComEC